MVLEKNRLRELDFLRGIAILLVLMRHQFLFDFTTKMGWIGVDLFFFLSGFLVSGLLFNEYLKFGNVDPKLFLIRRGFKIYPIYYLTYIIYLVPILEAHKFEWKGFLSDMFFLQNYVLVWGYAFGGSWSLAVEEHFYFGFALLIWGGLKYNLFNLKEGMLSKRISKFEIIIIALIILCFCLRFYNNRYFSDDTTKYFTMTHLRIDSLLAGVFVSYLYYFRNDFLTCFFSSYKKILLLLSLLLVSFSPIIEPVGSFYIQTFGFSFLYISFGILLVYFLIDKNINSILDKIFSNKIVNIISKIGFSSYSIYIIHTFVNHTFDFIKKITFCESLNQTLTFFVTSFISVFLGIFMTTYIEKYFLNIRDRFYPRRIN
jgi:peptidoglycan/LPS O-acetylase OafA/YrhL